MGELKKLPKPLSKLKKPPKTLYYEGDTNLLDKKLITEEEYKVLKDRVLKKAGL
jgi:hypothetical protein